MGLVALLFSPQAYRAPGVEQVFCFCQAVPKYRFQPAVPRTAEITHNVQARGTPGLLEPLMPDRSRASIACDCVERSLLSSLLGVVWCCLSLLLQDCLGGAERTKK